MAEHFNINTMASFLNESVLHISSTLNHSIKTLCFSSTLKDLFSVPMLSAKTTYIKPQIMALVKNELFPRLSLVPMLFAVLLVLTCYVYRAVYQVYFGPLKNIPGPKLAAFTSWYEVYYDIYLGGNMTMHVHNDLHPKYGPIVRIGRNEVHINDADYHEEIYNVTHPFSKYKPHQVWLGAPSSGAATISHHLHRLRRSALNPFFSTQAVGRFAPEIQSRMSALCDRLNNEYKGNSKRPVPMSDALGCYTADVIMQYSYARSYDLISTSKDFRSDFAGAVDNMVCNTHVLIHFPWLLPILEALPQSLVTRLNPAMAAVFAFKQEVLSQGKAMMGPETESEKNSAHKTVFRELLNSDLPPAEKTLQRLNDEAMIVVPAAMETTKVALALVIFHALNNPKILVRLRKELYAAWPKLEEVPTLQDLERLPYLTAVIQEALRLSYGPVRRLVRVSSTPITYNHHVLPPGTLFSMSTYTLHHSETIFPSSHTFNPSRWLSDPITNLPPKSPTGKNLTRYLSSFSKGSRICVGMHLAYAELYIGVANLMRRLEMELWETGTGDVEMVEEYFVPRAERGSKGVRVLIK